MSKWQYNSGSFVDRIEETAKIEEYARLLLDDRLIHPRTIIFTGAHGIGKSWLLSHLHQHLSAWNNLCLLMIDLATFSSTSDLSRAMNDIIEYANHVLFARPTEAGRSFAQSAADLIQEIKQVVLSDRPLVVMLDSVYESPWDLLGLLENHLLAPLIVERNVFVVMAGRGRPYP
ncbi:MAG: ATP-binding protein, partial [Caldilineaceae bacterium]|nr:ATP-binding protein [Caldilineaceae bacterium]